MAILAYEPLRLYPTSVGYVFCGSDAEVAGPILGVELAYDAGDFIGRVTVAEADLPAAIFELERAGEHVHEVTGRMAG